MEKKTFGLIATLLVIAAVLYFAAQYVDLSQALQIILQANPLFLIAALVLETVSMALKTLKWKTLLSELNPNIPFAELFKIQALGIAVSNITPARVGEATKVLYMEKHGVKKRLTLLTIVWEHLLDIIAIVLFSTLAATVYGSIAAIFLLATLALAALAYNVDFIVKKLSGFKQLAFLSEFTLHKFSKKTLGKAMLITILAWGVELTAVSLAFHAVGATLPFTQVIGIYAISIIIGLVSTIPGGLGSLDAALFLLLKETVTNNVLAAAIIAARLVTIGWIYAMGAVSALYLHRNK